MMETVTIPPERARFAKLCSLTPQYFQVQEGITELLPTDVIEQLLRDPAGVAYEMGADGVKRPIAVGRDAAEARKCILDIVVRWHRRQLLRSGGRHAN